MRRLALVASCLMVLPLVGGCSERADPASIPTPTASDGRTPNDDRACAVLQGDEFSRIPEAVEYQGLDGAARFLRLKSGPNIEGDVLVYLKPERAIELQRLASEIAEIDGASIVGTLTQQDTFEQFLLMFGEGAGDTITPTILPPLIAVEISKESTEAAMEELKSSPSVYDVIFRAESAPRLLASVRLVQEQFDDELGALAEDGPDELREAARALEGLGSPGTTTSDFAPKVIAASQVLIEFTDERCPRRELPNPLPEP